AGEGGANVTRVIGLDGKNSGCGGEETRLHTGGADHPSRARVGGHTDVFEDEGANEKVVEAREGIESRRGRGGDAGGNGERPEERQVDVGHGDRVGAKSGAQEANVSTLFEGNFVDDVLL